MVIPVDNGGKGQTMTRIIKHSEEDIEEQQFEDFRFVPMLKGIAK